MKNLNHKKINLFHALSIFFLATQIAACSKEVFVASRPEQSWQNQEAPLKVRPINKLLYTSNILTQVSAREDKHFLSSLLLQEIGKNPEGDSTITTELASIKPSDFDKNYSLLFQVNAGGSGTKIGKFHSDNEGGSTWDKLTVLSLVRKLKTDIAIDGEEIALVKFESSLQSWATEIVSASADIYQAASTPEIQQSFKKLIDQRINPEQKPQFYADSSIKELSKALPEDLKVITAVKASLLESTQAPRGMIKRIVSLTFEDFETTRKYSKELIGSPRLNNDEKKLASGMAIHKIDAAINLAGFAIDKIFGNSEEAKKYVGVAKSAVSVAKVVLGLNYKKIGADFATGNLIAGVSDLIGGFSEMMGLGGPSDNELLMQGIDSVRQDIKELGRHLDTRFDEMDKRLDLVNQKLDNQLQLLVSLSKSVDEVKAAVDHLSLQVSGLTMLTQSGFSDLMESNFLEKYESCLGEKSVAMSAPTKMTESEAARCLTYFVTRANELSKLGVRTGSQLPSDDLNSNLKILTSPDTEMQLAYLSTLIYRLGIASLPVEVGAINPVDWQIGVQSYLSLKLKFPNLPGTDVYGTNDLNQMQRNGKSIQSLLKEFSRPSLIKSIFDKYEEAFNLAMQSGLPTDLDAMELHLKLLARVMKLGFSAPGMNSPSTEALFDEEGTGFPNRRDITDGLMAKAAMAQVKFQEKLASLSLSHFLRHLENQPESSKRTVIDATLNRLELYIEGLK